MRALFITITFASLAVGCGLAPLSVIGEQCERNSDCDEPLVCGLGRCRRECEASRDCALGLKCIKLKEPAGLGVCQLPGENRCTLDSDCEAPLVCFTAAVPEAPAGGCLLECATEDDCIAGATCVEGECKEPVVATCAYDSDCPYPLECSARLTCFQHCSTTFDCAREIGESCVQHATCDGVDGRPNGPCMCRRSCTLGDDTTCPLGTTCVACGAGLDCDGLEAYCERPDPDGMMSGG